MWAGLAEWRHTVARGPVHLILDLAETGLQGLSSGRRQCELRPEKDRDWGRCCAASCRVSGEPAKILEKRELQKQCWVLETSHLAPGYLGGRADGITTT